MKESFSRNPEIKKVNMQTQSLQGELAKQTGESGRKKLSFEKVMGTLGGLFGATWAGIKGFEVAEVVGNEQLTANSAGILTGVMDASIAGLAIVGVASFYKLIHDRGKIAERKLAATKA